MSNYSEHFGQMLDFYMRQRGITAKDLAEKAFERMGFGSPSSASQFIGGLKKGWIYASPSTQRVTTSRTALPRLSIILDELGVPEGHDIVGIVRANITDFDASINGGFTYPLSGGFTLARVGAE